MIMIINKNLIQIITRKIIFETIHNIFINDDQYSYLL